MQKSLCGQSLYLSFILWYCSDLIVNKATQSSCSVAFSWMFRGVVLTTFLFLGQPPTWTTLSKKCVCPSFLINLSWFLREKCYSNFPKRNSMDHKFSFWFFTALRIHIPTTINSLFFYFKYYRGLQRGKRIKGRIPYEIRRKQCKILNSYYFRVIK